VARLEAAHAVAERLDEAGAVGAEDARLRHRRKPLADPDVEVVERRRAHADEHLARPRDGIGRLLEHEHLRSSVLVDTDCAHARQTIVVRPGDLEAVALELGIDAIGVAPAEPYEETERHIRERRERGLFADMKFTMARPEESCHPERLLPGARTVVSAALCYWAPEPER